MSRPTSNTGLCSQPLNYLCEGYYRFFNPVGPYMDGMLDLLKRGLRRRCWHPLQVVRW